MPDPKNYTVGWICAILTEYVAAQEFLDEEHKGPDYVSPHDNNDYTLGRIGNHNFVIAVLPNGEYGTASAASVASDMRHSFPNVRIGLMVGIGGGAPNPKHDIRLGDIVVSASGNGKSGVVQYDFGRAIQGQGFELTATLDQPPRILRAAMNGLQAQHIRKGNNFGYTIDGILQKNQLLSEYKRPDSSHDRLYRCEFIHRVKGKSCVDACGEDPSTLEPRPERTGKMNNPVIHYGLIASANLLMMNALIRDKLAEKHGILCFEMEAAGLMNHFPCLVIRGICDYSDSHKNGEWKGYASMAAAAYAKDLLSRISPNQIEAEKPIKEVLSNIYDTTFRTEDKIDKVTFKLAEKEDLEVLSWLTNIDYGPQQDDYFKRRQIGTGQWLLDSDEYQDWLKTNKQTFFCPGIPGAGKTICASIVIDDLITRFRNEPEVGIAYIYCNFREHDKQTIEHLLISLLKQLAQRQSTLSASVKDLYERHQKERTRPSLEKISRALCVQVAMYSRVFIVIDALDECQKSDGCREKLLSELFALQTEHGANIFATSRFIPDIVDRIKPQITIEIRASTNDVVRYLEAHMGELPAIIQQNSQLQEEVKTGISEAIDGMFLLAQIYLRLLKDKLTLNNVQNKLKDFRKQGQSSSRGKEQALAYAYKQALERIEGQEPGLKELARKVLSWIICARRPLTTSELQHALAIKKRKSKIDLGDQTPITDIISVCWGLVTVDEESNIIRLVHYTAQEYFEQTQSHWFSNAESNITLVCVTYLSFDVFKSGFCGTDSEFEERLQANPFFEYATQNWGHHARKVLTPSPELSQAIINFLESEMKVDASVQVLIAIKKASSSHNYSQRVPKFMTGLHLAAYFGIKTIVHLLLSTYKGAVEPKDSYGLTPLSWAAENQHGATAQLLLNTGKVDANSKDEFGQTPLLRAAKNGHEVIIQLLLNTGKVNPEAKDKYGLTPLSWAAKNGHRAIVQLLLNTGRVDANSKDIFIKTPLLRAAESGQLAIVQLLLSSGKVDTNLKDNFGRTPLSSAAEKRHEAIVQLLLNTGKVDADSKEELGQTPLSRAAEKGHEVIIQMLLNTGKVDADSKDELGQTPLLRATENGHKAVVQLLLKTGKFDVNSKDKYNWTPLLLATKKGHDVIVQLLLSTGKVLI